MVSRPRTKDSWSRYATCERLALALALTVAAWERSSRSWKTHGTKRVLRAAKRTRWQLAVPRRWNSMPAEVSVSARAFVGEALPCFSAPLTPSRAGLPRKRSSSRKVPRMSTPQMNRDRGHRARSNSVEEGAPERAASTGLVTEASDSFLQTRSYGRSPRTRRKEKSSRASGKPKSRASAKSSKKGKRRPTSGRRSGAGGGAGAGARADLTTPLLQRSSSSTLATSALAGSAVAMNRVPHTSPRQAREIYSSHGSRGSRGSPARRTSGGSHRRGSSGSQLRVASSGAINAGSSRKVVCPACLTTTAEFGQRFCTRCGHKLQT